MKTVLILVIFTLISFSFAGEREKLFADFHRENIEAEKLFDNAMSQN